MIESTHEATVLRGLPTDASECERRHLRGFPTPRCAHGRVTIYRFGDFELNASSRQLMRAGRPVAIQPKPFDLLLYLIRHRERVVSREELLSELWRGVHVDDVAVRFTLHATRRALGDDGKRQVIIRTAQRTGFQFVASVREIANLVPGVAALVEQRRSFSSRNQLSKQLQSLLAAAGRGEIRILLLCGGPDTGEPSAQEQLMEIANVLGFRVLHGRCVEPDGAPAFLAAIAGAAEIDALGSIGSRSSRAHGGAPTLAR